MGIRALYSATSKKLALLPSLTSPMPRPEASPLTSVVLPEPRLPVSATTSPGTRSPPILRPSSIVSFSLEVVTINTAWVSLEVLISLRPYAPQLAIFIFKKKPLLLADVAYHRSGNLQWILLQKHLCLRFTQCEQQFVVLAV